jgi:hypothetical protein
MAKIVRKGNWYRYRPGWVADAPADGKLVQVVNVPGGLTRGCLRHVQSVDGQVWLVQTANLHGPVPSPAKFVDLYR